MKKSFATACGGLLIVALAAGCATAQAPSAPRPAGFRAASVTFVSAGEAFALGAAPCGHASCTLVARTLDRGVSWREWPAPAAPLGEPYAGTGPALWGIRFATPEHGFVFGNGLWVTTSGGEHWSPVAYPGGAIMSLEIVDGHVSGFGGIAAQAGVAAVLDDSSVLVTSDGGLTVTKHAAPCPAAGDPFPLVTSVAVEAPHGLALLCTGQGYTGHTDKTVYVSGDLGATWTLAGHPGSAGDGGTIAASAPGQLTIATTSAASWLYYSADNGKTWRTVVTYLDGGDGWNDLGFTTGSRGVVIHGHPAYGDMLGQLLTTENSGLTWHAIKFLRAVGPTVPVGCSGGYPSAAHRGARPAGAAGGRGLHDRPDRDRGPGQDGPARAALRQ